MSTSYCSAFTRTIGNQRDKLWRMHFRETGFTTQNTAWCCLMAKFAGSPAKGVWS